MRPLTAWPLHLAGGVYLKFLWPSALEASPGNPGRWVTDRGYYTDFTEECEGALKVSIPQGNISPGISSLPCVSKDCSIPWGKGRGINSFKQRGRESNHKRLLNTENKLKVDGGGVGRGKMADGH